MTRAQVQEVLGLDLADRMALVQTLWESIRQSEEKIDLTADEKHFIDERVAAYEQHGKVRDWKEVRGELWPDLG